MRDSFNSINGKSFVNGMILFLTDSIAEWSDTAKLTFNDSSYNIIIIFGIPDVETTILFWEIPSPFFEQIKSIDFIRLL